jgi:hypothetical protein
MQRLNSNDNLKKKWTTLINKHVIPFTISYYIYIYIYI